MSEAVCGSRRQGPPSGRSVRMESECVAAGKTHGISSTRHSHPIRRTARNAPAACSGTNHPRSAKRKAEGNSIPACTRTRALIKEARGLLKSLNTSVKNRFRRDPEVLAKWQTASHIQRAPRKRNGESATPSASPAA